MGLLIETLADDFYEAAMLPDLWPSVLLNLSTSVSSVGAVVLIADGTNAGRWVASDSIGTMVEEWIAGQWHLRSQRGARLVGLRKPGFVSDQEAFTPDEMDADPGYTEFLRPRGLGWAAGTFVGMPTGDAAIVSIERRHDRGPFTPGEIEHLESLRPHLARSVLLAARLGLERARASVTALNAVGLPAALVKADARLIAANSLFERLDGSVVEFHFGRVSLVAHAADDVFSPRVRQIALGQQSACSLPIPAKGTVAAHIVHVLPVRKLARDIFTGAAGLIVVTPLASPGAPSAAVLEGLFDLTRAEARVASALGGGATIREISRQIGISEETVRTQLKAVFEKTGTRRQAELAGLLGGISPKVQQG
jgi:DNA-binding CsgD family transcriptional regulator